MLEQRKHESSNSQRVIEFLINSRSWHFVYSANLSRARSGRIRPRPGPYEQTLPLPKVPYTVCRSVTMAPRQRFDEPDLTAITAISEEVHCMQISPV